MLDFVVDLNSLDVLLNYYVVCLLFSDLVRWERSGY